MAPQIAIGDHAQKRVVRPDHADAAEALFGHGDQGFGHGRDQLDQRRIGPRVHKFPYGAQGGAELAAGMEKAKILGAEAAPFDQGHSQGVAHGDLKGGRGGRRIKGLDGFGGVGNLQHYIGGRTQRALDVGGDGDERNVEAARIGDDVSQFAGFAGLGKRQDCVFLADHPKIAVAGLAGMDEAGGLAGRGEGGGDLARHMAGFSHARADQPPLERGDEIDRAGEILAERPRHLRQGGGFQSEGAPPGFHRLGGEGGV